MKIISGMAYVLVALGINMIDELLENIKNLENKSVTIGINGEQGEQKKIVRRHSTSVKLKKGVKRESINPNLTVAQVALYNEFGGSKGKPPERSVVRAVFQEKKREITSLAKKLIKKPEIFYDVIGSYLLNEMKRKIRAGVAPQNAVSTIKRKGSSKPLIDSGQEFNALTYKVSSND